MLPSSIIDWQTGFCSFLLPDCARVTRYRCDDRIGWKLRDRSAISTRVRGGKVHLCCVIAFGSVSAPHVCGVLLAYFKDVPLVGEAVDGGLADTGLDQDVATELLRNCEACRFKGRLNV